MPDKTMIAKRLCTLVLGSLLACSLLLCACHANDSAASTESAEPETPKIDVVMNATPLVSSAIGLRNATVKRCGDAWYMSYVRSRVVPVVAPDRVETLNLGPWIAAKDYGATDARYDGSLTEWNDLYYITHDWSEYGQQILALWNGDHVTVNGRTVTVSWVCNYPKDSYYEEVRALAGEAPVVFQTCYPDSEYNRIVFAS